MDQMDNFNQSRREQLTKRLKVLRERAHLIELELKQYTGNHFRVCMFGSARIKEDDQIYKLTHKVAYLLGEEGIDVLTGGGPGLMKAANQGVKEGKNNSGSKSRSFGISIDLGFREPKNEHLDVKHHHRKFSSRLDDFMRLSNAIIVMPGGIGTALELFFSWQLLQVKHMSNRPIILLGREFWKGLFDWVKEIQIAQGLVDEKDLTWINVVDQPEEVIDIIREHYAEFLERLELNKSA